MSTLIFSDLHAHNWPRFATTLPTGVNSRFQDQLNILAQLDALIEEHDVSMLLMLGDLTHRRNYVSFSVYAPIFEWLATLSRRVRHEVKVIALVGNHDIESRGHHALAPLRHVGVDVIDTPQWRTLDGGVQALFCPYPPDAGSVEAMKIDLHSRAETKRRHNFYRVAFLHYVLDGKILDSEYAVPSPLALGDLDNFDRVIFGHIHSPSVEHDGRVQYVGAPMHFDFGDAGDRYAWLLRNGDDWLSPLVPIRLDAPKFVTTTYPKVPSPPLCGGFLRVLDTPSNLQQDVSKHAREMGWSDVVALTAKTPVEAIRALSAAVAVDEAVVRDYIARSYPDVDAETRQDVLDFALSCLQEAQK